MATIVNRDGRWQAKIRRCGYPTRTRTFMRRADAEGWTRKVEREMDASAWRDDVLPDLAQSSQVADGNRIRHLLGSPMTKITLARLRSADVAEFTQQRRREGVEPNTIRLDLSQISRVLQTAKSSWHMEHLVNPVRNLDKARSLIPPDRKRRLRPGEEERLMNAADPHFGQIIQFALVICARRGEIADLQWDNVALTRPKMRLVDTKNGTDRTVPFSSVARGILEDLPRRRDGRVFGMTDNQITKTMAAVREAAGIEDLRFHDLRHEAISRLFERTRLAARQIAQITGHKTAQMLWRYAHLRADDLVEALG